MDHVFNMRDAATRPSKLVALARQGESVTISIDGKPASSTTRKQAIVAQPTQSGLVPMKPQPVFGMMPDWPAVPWRSSAPLSDEELGEWGL